jgi:hypothetical protein
MENTVASQEFFILTLGLLLSFIVAASIAFTPIKEDEKAEEDPVDQQGLLKRAEPYKPKTTRPRYTSNNNSDPYYVKVNDDYYNDNIDYSNHQPSSHNCSSHDSSSHTSHDCGSHDSGGGWD